MQGKLIVFAGPMFAGKTEALLQRIAVAEAEGLRVEVFKPEADTRHKEAEVISHAKRSHRAGWFHEGIVLPSNFDVLAIDEAQFLTPATMLVVMAALKAGVQVILAGLDLTWKGEPFGLMPTFMAYADEVVKLQARCACGKSASRSYRLAQSEETVLVGGAEAYEPRCLPCFLAGG